MSNVVYEIPLSCLEDEDYTDDPMFDASTEGCEGCEFIQYHPVHCIGGQLYGSMGDKASCEKGHFRDEV